MFQKPTSWQVSNLTKLHKSALSRNWRYSILKTTDSNDPGVKRKRERERAEQSKRARF